MSKYQIAVVVGSIRKDSFNRKMASAIAKLAPAEFTFKQIRIDDLPLYNQDDDASPPAVWTASAGGFTFRYVIMWNSTNSIPVGYWDYGSSVVMSGTNGDTFTFTPDAANGVFQVT